MEKIEQKIDFLLNPFTVEKNEISIVFSVLLRLCGNPPCGKATK
jgi:hypothetical protein